jgi:NDP-sugar pyrophosphorylase family protein
MKILMPMAGKSLFFGDEKFPFPKPIIEICGKPMVQYVIDNFKSIDEPQEFIFILSSAECNKYHLDKILKLLTDGKCKNIKIEKPTKGAACSTLLAIDHIDNDDELVISNCDQVMDIVLKDVVSNFRKTKCDAGVVSFNSVHPRWSFVRLDEHGLVVETAEKRPISKSAIAGFYYFKKGSCFVKAAMDSIRKDSSVEGSFFIAPVLNELILNQMKIGTYPIEDNKYHTFYSPQKIEEYEKQMFNTEKIKP